MAKKLFSMSIVLVMIFSMFNVMQVSAATFDAEYNFNDTTTNFDPSADTTDAVVYQGNTPTISYGEGFSGASGDSALKMSIEPEGKERTGVMDFFSQKHEFGFTVRADSADASITNTTAAAYAFNANFKAAHKDVVAALIYPGTSTNGPSAGNKYVNSVIYLYNGKLYVGTTGKFQPETDECIAEPGVGNWFTLGAVFSSKDTRFDVFYNGTRIYGERRPSSYTAINRWHIYMNSSNETAHKPYNDGEFLYIDNLYAGQDFTKVKGYYIEVASTVPAKDATDVAIDSDFTFNFSIPMRTDLLSKALTVSPAATYNTVWTNDNQTLTLDFTEELQRNTTYTVSLYYKNWQSFVYETAKAGFSTSFTTEAISENDLYITDVTPSKDATNVDVNTSEIKLTFTRPVNTGSAEGKIKLSPGFDIKLGDFSWNDDATVLTIPIKGKLYGNSEYTVVIGDGILSADNKALIGDKSFTFKTGAGVFGYGEDFEDKAVGNLWEGTHPTDPINGLLVVGGKNSKVDIVSGNNVKIANDNLYTQLRLYPQADAKTPGIARGKDVALSFKIKLPTDTDLQASNKNFFQYYRYESGGSESNLISYDSTSKTFTAAGYEVGTFTPNEWMEFGFIFHLEESGGENSNGYVEIFFNKERKCSVGMHEGQGLLNYVLINAYTNRASNTEVSFELDDIIWSENTNIVYPNIALTTEAVQQNIEITDLLQLDFNTPVKDTVLSDAITVTCGGKDVVVKNAYLSNQSKTLRIEVDGGLKAEETYTVTIDADVMKSAYDRPFTGSSIAVQVII